MIKLQKKLNRIELNLTAIPMGKDLCIALTGGKAHIGSVTVGGNGICSETYVISDHKEYVLTKKLGEFLKGRYSGSFAICCGIHFDDITKQEITDVMDLSCQLVEEVCRHLKKQE